MSDDDSGSELPLPMSPPHSNDSMDQSNGSGSDSSRPGSPDSATAKIPTPPEPEGNGLRFEEIPLPDVVPEVHMDSDGDGEIPLPPDPSKYSPSQVLAGGDDDDFPGGPDSFSEKKTTMTVLGKAQAKKRLLAFSAAKQAASAHSSATTTLKKTSPTKPLQIQKQQQQQPTLAIASIKEEETKIKEMIAMNSLLADKLHQVKMIATAIPTMPPATAIVKPTVMSVPVATVVAQPDISEIVLDAKIPIGLVKPEPLEEFKPKVVKPSRKSRRHYSSSSSRSNYSSKSRSPTPDKRSKKKSKRSRSRERDTKKEDKEYRKKDREKNRRSRSQSSSHDRSLDKEKSKLRDKDKYRKRASRSPSSAHEAEDEKKRKISPQPLMSKDSDRYRDSRDREYDRGRDKDGRKSGKSYREPDPRESRDNGKESDKYSRDPREGYISRRDRELRERAKVREERHEQEAKKNRKSGKDKKEVESESEPETQTLTAEEAERSRRLDKVRKTRMPVDWTEFREYEYDLPGIRSLWNMMKGNQRGVRSRSRSGSNSPTSGGRKWVEHPSKLSKSLHIQERTKVCHLVMIPRKDDLSPWTRQYPDHLTRWTRSKPRVMYGYKELTYLGYYKTREQIFEESDEIPAILAAMREIMCAKTTVIEPHEPKSKQEWYATSEQNFIPTEGSKRILISHLYSDDDTENSPAIPTKSQLDRLKKKSKSKSSPEFDSNDNEDSISMDSAPSPLLKQKYSANDVRCDSPFVLEKDTVKTVAKSPSPAPIVKKVEEVKRRRHESSHSDVSVEIRTKDTKKPDSKDKRSVPVEKVPVTDSKRALKSSDAKPDKHKEKEVTSKGRSKAEAPPPEPSSHQSDLISDEEMELDDPLPISKKEKKEKEGKKEKKAKKKHKKHRKHKKGKGKTDDTSSEDEVEQKKEQAETSDSEIIEKKASKKQSRKGKDKPVKSKPERRKRKGRKSESESVDSESSSDDQGSDDGSKKPKKKRTKVLTEEIKTKSVEVSKPVQPKVPIPEPKSDSDAKPVKEKSKNKKKKNDKEKTVKKKHKKRTHSTSSSEESVTVTSEGSSSSEPSSDEEESSKKKKKKPKKDKLKKKDKKESDDEDGDGGGRNRPRPSGGGGGTNNDSKSSQRDKYHRSDRNKDRDRNRDRHSGKGSYSYQGGRRRDIVNPDDFELSVSLESGEVTDEEELNLGLKPPSVDQFGEVLPSGIINKLKETEMQRRLYFEQETQDCLSAFDDDALLVSILQNESISSANLLEQISGSCPAPAPAELEQKEEEVTVNNGQALAIMEESNLSNWSEDSEDELSLLTAKEDVPMVEVLSPQPVPAPVPAPVPPPVIPETQDSNPKPEVDNLEKDSTAQPKNLADEFETEKEKPKERHESGSKSDAETRSRSRSSCSNTSRSPHDGKRSSGSVDYSRSPSSSLYEPEGLNDRRSMESSASKSVPTDGGSFKSGRSTSHSRSRSRSYSPRSERYYKYDKRERDSHSQRRSSSSVHLPENENIELESVKAASAAGRHPYPPAHQHHHSRRHGSSSRSRSKSRSRSRSISPRSRRHYEYERRYGRGRKYFTDYHHRKDNRRFHPYDREGSRRDMHSRVPRDSSLRYRIRDREREPYPDRSHRVRDREREPYPDRSHRVRDREREPYPDRSHRVRDREREPYPDRSHRVRDKEYESRADRERSHSHYEEDGRKHRHRYDDREYDSQDRAPRNSTSEDPKPSPPLQLNIADSTISDAELATAVPPTNSNSFIGGISADVLSGAQHFHPDNFAGTVSNIPLPVQSVTAPVPGYVSPPRRLSLDERLEMEMGIKLKDDPPKPQQQVYYPPPYFQHQFSQPPPLNGKFLGPPFTQPPPNHMVHPGVEDHSWQFQGQPKPGFPGPHVPPHQQAFGNPARQQSQIIQVGNMLQVVPAELPTAPITFTATSMVHSQHFDANPILGTGESLGKALEPSLPQKRVVTIKVPVVPFTVPVRPPTSEDQLQREADEQALRRKLRERKLRKAKRRLEERRALKKKAKDAEKERRAKEKAGKPLIPGTNPDTVEEISAEELALLKEAMSETPFEGPDGDESIESEVAGQPDEPMTEAVAETKDLPDEVSSINKLAATDDMQEADEAGDAGDLEMKPETDDKEFKVEKVTLPVRKPIEILPAPSLGILVAIGFRERSTTERKAVKFADGINPGYGSSPSGAEDMPSPPPAPAFYPYKKSVSKKKKGKSSRKKPLRATPDLCDDADPPPCPTVPYPYCPPGILYQVCPQYAVLYAQAMAELGIDIIFEPSTQQPYTNPDEVLPVPEPSHPLLVPSVC